MTSDKLLTEYEELENKLAGEIRKLESETKTRYQEEVLDPLIADTISRLNDKQVKIALLTRVLEDEIRSMYNRGHYNSHSRTPRTFDLYRGGVLVTQTDQIDADYREEIVDVVSVEDMYSQLSLKELHNVRCTLEDFLKKSTATTKV